MLSSTPPDAKSKTSSKSKVSVRTFEARRKAEIAKLKLKQVEEESVRRKERERVDREQRKKIQRASLERERIESEENERRRLQEAKDLELK